MSTDNESFMPVPGYDGRYVINRNGVIKSLCKAHFHHILSQRVDKRSGYPCVKLHRQKDRTEFLHRLLALAFIPNPQAKKYVNHLNANKLDYRLENLEWATASENSRHAYKLGLCKAPPPFMRPVINRCTGERFKSIEEAARLSNISRSTLEKRFRRGKGKAFCLEYDINKERNAPV